MSPLNSRILIIDDDRDNSELIELMLRYSDTGYDITTVRTSEEGLRLAAAQHFDLFVLDYRLLGMNGAEVCRTIRRTDADTPVMFFTGEAFEHERWEALQAGANAYLVKPDDLTKLTETAKDLIGGGREPTAGREGLSPAYLSAAPA